MSQICYSQAFLLCSFWRSSLDMGNISLRKWRFLVSRSTLDMSKQCVSSFHKAQAHTRNTPVNLENTLPSLLALSILRQCKAGKKQYSILTAPTTGLITQKNIEKTKQKPETDLEHPTLDNSLHRELGMELRTLVLPNAVYLQSLHVIQSEGCSQHPHHCSPWKPSGNWERKQDP